MRRLHCTCLLLIVAAGLVFGAAPALAVSPVITDCRSQKNQTGLTGHYTVAQLRYALAHLSPGDLEYSDCYQVIEDQLTVQLSRSHVSKDGGSGSGGSFISAPLIIALVVIVLAGGGGFALAARRRASSGPGAGSPPPPAAGE